MIDRVLMNFVATSERSWWILRYRDGSFKCEWQEHPTGSKLLIPSQSFSSISEWENTDKMGVVQAMLVCPNGQVGGFNDPSQLFQFKVGHVSINTADLWCDAHVLGAVTDDEGNCDYIAYEPLTMKVVADKDNIQHMKYKNIGKLDPSVVNSCR